MPKLQSAPLVVGLYARFRPVTNFVGMPSKPDLTLYLGRTVTVRIDRLLGSVHPRFHDMTYPVNYGFLPGTKSGDGMEIDAYILGLDAPATSDVTGRVVAVLVRNNDAEDKLVIACDEIGRTASDILDAVAFCERYFDTKILTV